MTRLAHPVSPNTASEPEALERAAYLASVDRGLAELDAGQYVSGEDVVAWASALFTPDELPLPPVRQR